ncbi:MAG: hypothetical protein QOE62_4011 [Actinomycetota bacterium]|nr:hypothetical protein [Actinomycetota bacterium]
MRMRTTAPTPIYMISPLYLWSHDAMRKRYPALADANPPNEVGFASPLNSNIPSGRVRTSKVPVCLLSQFLTQKQ